MTSEAKSAEQHRQRGEMVDRQRRAGGSQEREASLGTVRGTHYLELVEPIKQLKREGRLEDALALCYQAIEGAERSRTGRGPAPWYTEQAAIIHRKLKQRDLEIAVLQRYLDACPIEIRSNTRITERLNKLLS